MNNEIKEILDFKEDADYKKLSVDEIVILENYITNLQEENKRLKEYQESYRKEIDYWRIQFSNKEDKIEKAIEYINKEKYDIETTFKISSKDFLEENITSVVPSFKLLEILKEGK